MSRCIRCGQHATQYGTDGMPYCDSCWFYGMNKQCQKCGMYLPSLELQMYRGQWYCQYCVMDLRDQNRPHYEKKKDHYTQDHTREHCDRCGKNLHSMVYIYNGRKLCKSCVDDEKGRDHGPVTPPIMKFSLKKKSEPFYTPIFVPMKTFGEGLFGWLLVKLGLRKKMLKTKKEAEIVEVENIKNKEGKKKSKDKKKRKKSKKKKNKTENDEENEKNKEQKFDWSQHKKD